MEYRVRFAYGRVADGVKLGGMAIGMGNCEKIGVMTLRTSRHVFTPFREHFRSDISSHCNSMFYIVVHPGLR